MFVGIYACTRMHSSVGESAHWYRNNQSWCFGRLAVVLSSYRVNIPGTLTRQLEIPLARMFSWGIFNREFAIFSQQRPISALPWLKCIYREQHEAVITLLNSVSLKLGARTLHSKTPECCFFATQLNGHRVQFAFLFSCVLIRSGLTPRWLDNFKISHRLCTCLFSNFDPHTTSAWCREERGTAGMLGFLF